MLITSIEIVTKLEGVRGSFFFIRDRSYQGLKDATSFGLISDKSAEKLEWKNSNFGHFSIMALGTILSWYYSEGFPPDFSIISWNLIKSF